MPKAETAIKKLSPKAFEQQLSAPQLAALRAACSKLGFAKGAEFAAEHFNLKVSGAALHRWYHRDDHLLVLSMVASGAVMNSRLEDEFKKNPAPQMATLVKLFQTLIMQLAVQGAAEPAMLDLANTLFKSALEYLRQETSREKLALDARRVALLEKKAAQADQTEKVIKDADLTPEQRVERIKEIYGRI